MRFFYACAGHGALDKSGIAELTFPARKGTGG